MPMVRRTGIRYYDYEAAKKAGLGPDSSGHWPSRDPKTGRILKGMLHPTFHKTIEGEAKAGHEFYVKGGVLYSRPKKEGTMPKIPNLAKAKGTISKAKRVVEGAVDGAREDVDAAKGQLKAVHRLYKEAAASARRKKRP